MNKQASDIAQQMANTGCHKPKNIFRMTIKSNVKGQKYEGHSNYERQRLYSDGLHFMKYLEIENALNRSKKVLGKSLNQT